jgi:uncharacterized membrane protein (DUF373 family)
MNEVVASHTSVHRFMRRFLEPTQDVLVLALGVILFALIARTLGALVLEVLSPVVDFRVVIAGVLFVLVMVEIQRLLIVYTCASIG